MARPVLPFTDPAAELFREFADDCSESLELRLRDCSSVSFLLTGGVSGWPTEGVTE